MSNDRPATHPSSPRRALAAAAIAVLAGMTVGCDRQPEQNAALQQARGELASLSAGGVAPPPQVRQATYTKVVSQLRPVAGDLEGPAQATALQLLGEAEAGLAQIEATEAADAARETLRLLADIDIAAREYARQRAVASAMEMGDAGADIEDISQQIAQVEQEIRERQRERDRVRQEIAELNRRAEEQIAQGRQTRQEEIAIRDQALSSRAAERAPLIEQAYRVSRRADAFERQAADLQAEAEIRRPELAAVEFELEQFGTQKRLLEESRAAVQRDLELRQERAAEALEMARSAGQTLEQLAQALAEQVEQRLIPAFDSASGQYEAALRSLRSASSAASRDALAPQLATTAAQQSLADLKASQARTLETLADAAFDTASIRPAPPAADRFRSIGEQASALAEQAKQDAASLYRDVARAVQTTASRAASPEAANALAQALNETADALAPEQGGAAFPGEPEFEPEFDAGMADEGVYEDDPSMSPEEDDAGELPPQ